MRLSGLQAWEVPQNSKLRHPGTLRLLGSPENPGNGLLRNAEMRHVFVGGGRDMTVRGTGR